MVRLSAAELMQIKLFVVLFFSLSAAGFELMATSCVKSVMCMLCKTGACSVYSHGNTS